MLLLTAEPSLRDRVAALTANPNVAFILAAVGIVAIYAECCAPGMILPGALGGIATVVGIYALCQHPLNWTGAALMLAGLALFAIDAIIGARGVLGALGACALAIGATMLIASPAKIRSVTAWSVALPLAALTVFLTTTAVRARHNKQEISAPQHDR
jgi:membrane-bound serine protease (ClpP class)